MFLAAFEISLSATRAYDWQYYRSFLNATPVALKYKSETLRDNSSCSGGNTRCFNNARLFLEQVSVYSYAWYGNIYVTQSRYFKLL